MVGTNEARIGHHAMSLVWTQFLVIITVQWPPLYKITKLGRLLHLQT